MDYRLSTYLRALNAPSDGTGLAVATARAAHVLGVMKDQYPSPAAARIHADAAEVAAAAERQAASHPPMKMVVEAHKTIPVFHHFASAADFSGPEAVLLVLDSYTGLALAEALSREGAPKHLFIEGMERLRKVNPRGKDKAGMPWRELVVDLPTSIPEVETRLSSTTSAEVRDFLNELLRLMRAQLKTPSAESQGETSTPGLDQDAPVTQKISAVVELIEVERKRRPPPVPGEQIKWQKSQATFAKWNDKVGLLEGSPRFQCNK